MNFQTIVIDNKLKKSFDTVQNLNEIKNFESDLNDYEITKNNLETIKDGKKKNLELKA